MIPSVPEDIYSYFKTATFVKSNPFSRSSALRLVTPTKRRRINDRLEWNEKEKQVTVTSQIRKTANLKTTTREGAHCRETRRTMQTSQLGRVYYVLNFTKERSCKLTRQWVVWDHHQRGVNTEDLVVILHHILHQLLDIADRQLAHHHPLRRRLPHRAQS